MAANTIITSIVTGGTNTHTTVAEEANSIATDFITAGVVGSITLGSGSTAGTGSFAVQADSSPDMGVTVKSGQAYISATPSSQDAQVLRARAAADYTSYTINANTSGSTKYDWIYLSVNATKANNPAADASDVTSIVTSRSTSNTTDNGSPPTYGLLLAIVTVANGASSITNSNITDSRVNAAMNNLTTGATSGWVAVSGQWTYASYTSPTGTITVPSDATTTYSAGMRVKFSNNGATQYGIITKVASTTLTVYFGTDYSLTNSAITSVYYSFQKAPFGFPLDPAKWTVTTTSTTGRTVSATSWTSLTDAITVPIGAWKLSMECYVSIRMSSTATANILRVTLSSDGSTETNPKTTLAQSIYGTSGINAGKYRSEDDINVTTATTFTVMGICTTTTNLVKAGITSDDVPMNTTSGQLILKAVCAYL